MKKILLLIIFFSAFANALSLEQVRNNLMKNLISRDSVEMRIRTSVSSPMLSGKQNAYIYMVRKGNSKIYTEMKLPFVNQRFIVNGNRMKVIDLSTRESEILPYNGEPLKAAAYMDFNPLMTGEWQEPKLVSGNIYAITGEKGTLYYDSKKNRIEKMENETGPQSTLTSFTYDLNNNMKTMRISVIVDSVETEVLVEILTLRHSKDFSDHLFEF
jgi:outer membrane lipoprotein-sorting protein